MKVWRDKKGKWLTAKEFTARFREGVQKITPLQVTVTTLWGQGIVLSGIILGIIINIIFSIWWLVIVLIGSILITSMSILATYQKYIFLKGIEETMKEIDDDKIEKEVEK